MNANHEPDIILGIQITELTPQGEAKLTRETEKQMSITWQLSQ